MGAGLYADFAVGAYHGLYKNGIRGVYQARKNGHSSASEKRGFEGHVNVTPGVGSEYTYAVGQDGEVWLAGGTLGLNLAVGDLKIEIK